MRRNDQQFQIRTKRQDSPITVRIDNSMRTRLVAHSRTSDLTVSQLIRRAIKHELAAIARMTSDASNEFPCKEVC